MKTGTLIDLTKKICYFLMADQAVLLALPEDRIHAVYEAVVPPVARVVSWKPWMEV
jgi:hypothetical protein